MKCLKIALLVALVSSALAAIPEEKYKECPSNVTVESVRYDKKIPAIVVHVHAKVFFFNIDKIYAIKVKNGKTIEKSLDVILGQHPEVVELEVE